MKSRATTYSQNAGAFGRTQWSLVLKAARHSENATEAFERLAKVYWRPLYEFVRRNGYQPADAKDLVQGFFEYLVKKRVLGSVNPAKGRFRSFLLGLLRHFVANTQRVQRAQKRGGGQQPLPLDELSAHAETSSACSIDCTPDEEFDAHWAETLVNQVLMQLKAEYDTAGRANVFASLNRYLSPLGSHDSYTDVAPELGMKEDAVKTAVNRLRRRFRELLRSWIGETVSEYEDVGEEYRYLTRVLTRTER